MVNSSHIELSGKKEERLAVLLLAIYFTLHLMQARGIGPEYVRFYTKDLILIPLLIIATKLVLIVFQKKIGIGAKEIVITTVYVSVAFEVFFPILDLASGGDWIDVCCYAFGALVYHRWVVNEKHI